MTKRALPSRLRWFGPAIVTGLSVACGDTGSTGTGGDGGATASSVASGSIGAPTAQSSSSGQGGGSAGSPRVGAHGLSWFGYGANALTEIESPPLATKPSGSTLLVSVGRGQFDAFAPPT